MLVCFGLLWYEQKLPCSVYLLGQWGIWQLDSVLRRPNHLGTTRLLAKGVIWRGSGYWHGQNPGLG